MPFVNCPSCNELIHLNVRDNLEEWDARFPKSSANNRYAKCFGCWKELQELDVVKVLTVPETEKDRVSIGDTGAVVFVYSKDAFEVECVLPDGSTKWLTEFPRNFIKYVQNPQNS